MKNSDLLSLIKVFKDLNRENILANDLSIVLPFEKEISKSINFNNIDANSDSLSKPIINQDKNKITCFCPQKKFIFGPFFPSSYNAPIEINFISFINNLKVNIIPKEKKYESYFDKFVDNINNYVKIIIKIPDLDDIDKEMEEHLIDTKIIFSSESLEKCEVDFEFKFIIIPLYYFITCKNYKLVKYNDGLLLYNQKFFSNSKIHYIIKNYNYNEEPKYQLDITSLEDNNCEKPEIIKDKQNKENLFVIIKNDNEKIKFLNCLLNIKINNEFNMPLYIQGYVIPFIFELEVYNYNLKEYSNQLEIFITKNDLPLKNYILHCQFIMPDISFASTIDIDADESEYFKIIDKERIFNELKLKPLSNFSFDLKIEINDKILKIINKNGDYTYRLEEFNIYFTVENIKKYIKIFIKKPPQFINFKGYNNIFPGIPLYKFNPEKKGWKKIEINSKYNNSELHINTFGIANYFEIEYRDRNVTLGNIDQKLNKFVYFECARKEYRIYHFIKCNVKNEQYSIEMNSQNSSFIIGIYDNKYWYPLFNYYPKEFENYKLLNYTSENNNLAEKYINKINNSNDICNFMKMTKLIFEIKSLRIQNKNDNIRELLNEFLSYLPSEINNNIEGLQDLLDQINLNEEYINIKLLNTVIILYNIFIKKYNEIKNNEYKIYLNFPNKFISDEDIQAKVKELKNNYLKFDTKDILKQNHIKNLFPILKEIPSENKLNNSLPKNPLVAFKKKEKHEFFEANINQDHEYIIINDFDEMIKKEKMESINANIIIKEINYPDNYNLLKLINFYSNCINTIRELPLYIVSSLDNKDNLKKAEKIYLQLLVIYNLISKNDESLLCNLIKSFSDSFEKMTNNLIKSKVNLENLLPSKFIINNNEINDKEYIKIPNKKSIDLIQFLFWNISKKEDDYRNSIIKKTEDIMTEFSISSDNLDKSLSDLEKKKIQYNNFQKECENINDFEEKNNMKNLNQSKIDIKFKKDKDNEEKKKRSQNIRHEEYILALDDDDFDKKENDEMIQEKSQNNENNEQKEKKKQIQLNSNIQNKEYKQVDLSKFNFNPLIIIKLVIERMKEIDKIIDKNNKPSLELKYDFNVPNIPQENINETQEFRVKKLYNLGKNLCCKLIKNICEKDVPFNEQSVYILFDCSGFISIKNKLKLFVIICGLTNALNIVNIPYTLILIGDSDFNCIIKNFSDNHSMEILQKMFDCLFIKRFIQKNVKNLLFSMNYKHPDNKKFRSFFIFTDGLDEDFLLSEQWNENIFNNSYDSFCFLFIKSDELNQESQKQNLEYLNGKWKNFEDNSSLSRSRVKVIIIDNNIKNETYDLISSVFCETIMRNYNLCNKSERTELYPPLFNISEENVKNFNSFEKSLDFYLEDSNEFYLKITDSLNGLKLQNNKLNTIPYKNKLNKIIPYKFDESLKSILYKYVRKFILNSSLLNQSKLETIYKPNKPSQKVLSSTGTEFDIPSLILYLLAPTAEPMIYLEEKGGLIKNYCVTVIIDSSYSCFNELCFASSLQNIRFILSSLYAVDLPCFNLIVARSKNPYVLCTYTSTGAALQGKSLLWESLFSVLDKPCDCSDLPSAIQCAYDIIRMNSVQYTNYMYIFTDGLCKIEDEDKILNVVNNCVNYGVNTFCFGIGIYPKKIEKLFPQIIYSPNPYNLNKCLGDFFGESISGNSKVMPFLEIKNNEDLENIINDFLNEEDYCIFKKTKEFLSKIIIKTDAFKLISTPQKRLSQSELKLASNPTGENCELLKKNSLLGAKILYIGCYYGKDALFNKNESRGSEACFNDAVSFLGITLENVKNYDEAIKKITTLTEDGKCQYFSIFLECDSGSGCPAYTDQLIDCLLLFWKNGGSICILTDNYPFLDPANRFLEKIDFDGKKVNFRIGGNHYGTKFLTGDLSGELKEKGTFSKKVEYNANVERLPLDHNLNKLYEGITISYACNKSQNLNNPSPCDDQTILPFKKFFVDSDGGISSLFYLSDEKGRGDIFLDGGFTKVYHNFKKTDSAYRYFQNIVCFFAREESHLIFDGVRAKDWRPKGFTYSI